MSINWITMHLEAGELRSNSSTHGQIKSLLPPHGTTDDLHQSSNINPVGQVAKLNYFQVKSIFSFRFLFSIYLK